MLTRSALGRSRFYNDDVRHSEVVYHYCKKKKILTIKSFEALGVIQRTPGS